ncbi:MAG: methyltransferase [Mariprofundus sp.]|nr:methyltransferase [Mariprofundus sp.]
MRNTLCDKHAVKQVVMMKMALPERQDIWRAEIKQFKITLLSPRHFLSPFKLLFYSPSVTIGQSFTQFIQSQTMIATKLLYQAALEIPSRQTLIINAHAHALLTSMESIDLQQHFKPEYTAIKNIGLSVFPALPDTSRLYDLILLLPAKNKQQTLGWMAEAMNRLSTNGKFMFACANAHGAKSYEAALKKLAGNVSSRSKSKCRLCSARKLSAFNASFAAQWLEDARPRSIESHGMISRPGLFSWDHADTGSSLLIKQLPVLRGIGMDLCCGYGLLTENILRQSTDIKQIHLLDADWLALDCARQNTTTWQNIVQWHWKDAMHNSLPKQLDWVVCNPPFHSDQSRDVGLGQSIVLHACQSLKRGGQLYLVANRQLPYEQLLRSELRQCQILVEADGFKVIKGIR